MAVRACELDWHDAWLLLYVYIGTAGKAAVSAVAGGEAVKPGWQYWAFMGVGLVASIAITIWVTKIARDALRKTTDVSNGLHR